MAWEDRGPVEQAAIGYCAPRGIPLSVFRGRVVYPGDPEWLPEDQEAVFDWLAHEASRCPDCRQPLKECTAEENSFAYRAKSRRCHSCYAVAAEAARLNNAGSPPASAGHRYVIGRVEAN